MQQWMSALLDDGFVAVKKLKDKQGLADEMWSGRPATAVTPGNIYRVEIHALVKRWTKTVEMDGDYIEK